VACAAAKARHTESAGGDMKGLTSTAVVRASIALCVSADSYSRLFNVTNTGSPRCEYQFSIALWKLETYESSGYWWMGSKCTKWRQ
jgi:hypothetical protein